MLSSRCLHLITKSAEKLHLSRIYNQWIFPLLMSGCSVHGNAALVIYDLWRCNKKRPEEENPGLLIHECIKL